MKKAFTLIEMLVTISIMTILFGMGVAAYRNLARRQSLEQAAAEVSQTLTQAQANALGGKKINCAAETLAGWQVRFLAGNYTLEEACQITNYIVKTVYYPVSVTGTLPSPNPILFRVLSQGTNIPVSTTITLNNSQSLTKSIIVSSTGEIK